MMHRSVLASMVVLSLFPLALPVRAQQVGDKVVVISDSVEIKVRQDVIDTTRAGAIFLVREVQGDRIGVNSVHGTGFLEKRHVIPLSKAVSHWSGVIRSDSKNSAALIGRGLAYRELRDYDKAIADYSEALRLDPKSVAAYLNRGSVWSKKREYDKAIADYTEAIRLDPKYAGAYSNRGAAWQNKGDYDKAIANYNEAIRLDPQYARPYDGRAWIWATCPDARFRDGKRAVVSALRACELEAGKGRSNIGTLAAAYAEAGDFENAVKWQARAVELASTTDKAPLQKRLELFRSGKPFREEPKK